MKEGRLFPDVLFLYHITVASLFYLGKYDPKAVALGSVWKPNIICIYSLFMMAHQCVHLAYWQACGRWIPPCEWTTTWWIYGNHSSIKDNGMPWKSSGFLIHVSSPVCWPQLKTLKWLLWPNRRTYVFWTPRDLLANYCGILCEQVGRDCKRKDRCMTSMH